MKIAIYGYGNLGRGVEAAMRQNPDVDLIGVFSRRDPATVKTRTGTPVYAAADILNYKDKIDVLILCGGSATDLPELTPALAKDFCVVDTQVCDNLYICTDDGSKGFKGLVTAKLEELINEGKEYIPPS